MKLPGVWSTTHFSCTNCCSSAYSAAFLRCVATALEPRLQAARESGLLGETEEVLGACMLYTAFTRRYGRERAPCLMGHGSRPPQLPYRPQPRVTPPGGLRGAAPLLPGQRGLL